MKRFAALLPAILLAGCQTTANYELMLDSWVGVHVDRLVMAWGPPSNAFMLSDGGQVIEYAFAEDEHITSTSTPVVMTNWCRTQFTVTPARTIASWKWQGNFCVAPPPE